MSVLLAGLVLSIPPGPLYLALGEWSTQTDWQVLFPFKDLSDVYTQGVQCDCGPEEALQSIIAGLPVTYHRSRSDRSTTVTINYSGSGDREGTTPTWYTQEGWSYICQPLSWFSGFTLSPPDQLAVRLGVVDIGSSMLCYRDHPTAPDEAIEITMDDVVVQSHRRLQGHGPRW